MSSFKLRAAAAEFSPPSQQSAPHTIPVFSQHNSDNQQTSQTEATHGKGPQQGQEQRQQSAAPPAAEQLVSSSAQEPQEDEYYDEYEDYDESWGYYDEEGTWVPYNGDEGWDQRHSDAAAGTSCDSPQAQQHAGPQTLNADDAVGLLHSCYPTHPQVLLQQLVDACDGNAQQAARILSDMDYEQRKARIAAAAAAGTPTTSNHSSSISSEAVASRKQQQGFDYSLDQFPALGQPASSNGADPRSTQRPGSSNNWAAITSKPAAASRQANISSRHKQPAMAAAAGPTVRVSPLDSTASAAVPWVETGAAVSQEYAAARAEASDHARVRNACFQQATLAYMSGNKALAKELSAKGKAAAEAMWAAHDRASSHIFESRNARLQQQQRATAGGRSGAVIDLHGLHVQEMMQTLPQQLAALTAQQQESVSIIVGVGRHTKGPPSARMAPAAEALLKDLGYSFSQPQPGLLRVRLR